MLEIKVYNNTNQFWNAVSPTLIEEEAKNCLFLGLLNNFRSDDTDCMYQSAVFENGRLVSALLISRFRGNSNIVATPIESEEVARVLIEGLEKSGSIYNGLIAEKSSSEIYQKLFKELGLGIEVHMRQGIYYCNKVTHTPLPKSLNFRLAEKRDIETVGEWIEGFHREAVPHDPPITGKDAAAAKIDQKMVYLLENEDGPISMAGWSRDIGTSCSVNLVYTPKELRKNGYASMVTARITQEMLNRGKKETNLFTDLDNPTSNKIYQNIGYKFVCNSIHLGLTR